MKKLSKTPHGGRRTGAGRRNLSGKTNHMKRPSLTGRQPVLVTLKVKDHIPSLTSRKRRQQMKTALTSCKKQGCRIIDSFGKRRTLSFLIEAEDLPSLAKMMQSFTIRFAKRINGVLSTQRKKTSGAVFHGRYQMSILETAQEISKLVHRWRSPCEFFLRGFSELDQELRCSPQFSITLLGLRKVLRP